jgi:PmbA protein
LQLFVMLGKNACMQPLKTLEKLLEYAAKAGATASDGLFVESVDLTVSERNGAPEQLERSEHTGVGLRVWVGERLAQGSTSSFADDALKTLAENTVAFAKCAPADPLTALLPREMLAVSPPQLALADDETPSPETLRALCREAEGTALAYKGILNSEGADASASKSSIALMTRANNEVQFSGAYAATGYSLSVSVLAGTLDAMERDYAYSSKRQFLSLKSPIAIGDEAAMRALQRVNPRKIPTASMPIVFDPRVSRGLLGNFLNAISGAAVARGTTFLKEALHTPVFSSAITIVDDPHISFGLASRPFDAEGAKNGKLTLVSGGVLETWLLDQRSAAKLGLQTTGHASRGLTGAPQPSSSNAYMAAGKESPQALISGVSKGLYVTETFGMGVNLVTGDYSQGAAGFMIENGELTYQVSEITIAGHLGEMFKTLIPADDLKFDYAVNAPTLLVPNMMVAGS